MGACTLSRDAFRFSDGVELKAATQVVCEHVQLLPGAIGGIAFSGHDVESELAAQFGEGFLLAALRLKLSRFRRNFNKDLPIEFTEQNLSSFGGLELFSRYLRRVELSRR